MLTDTLATCRDNIVIDDTEYNEFAAGQRVTLVILFVIITIAAIVTNGFLWVVILSTPKLFQSNMNFLLLSSSLAETLMAVTNLPFSAAVLFRGRYLYSCVTCRVLGFLHEATVMATILSVSSVSFFRYLKVCQPRLYFRYFTELAVCSIIAVQWLLSVSTHFVILVTSAEEVFFYKFIFICDTDQYVRRILQILGFSALMLLLIFCDASVYRKHYSTSHLKIAPKTAPEPLTITIQYVEELRKMHDPSDPFPRPLSECVPLENPLELAYTSGYSFEYFPQITEGGSVLDWTDPDYPTAGPVHHYRFKSSTEMYKKRNLSIQSASSKEGLNKEGSDGSDGSGKGGSSSKVKVAESSKSQSARKSLSGGFKGSGNKGSHISQAMSYFPLTSIMELVEEGPGHLRPDSQYIRKISPYMKAFKESYTHPSLDPIPLQQSGEDIKPSSPSSGSTHGKLSADRTASKFSADRTTSKLSADRTASKLSAARDSSKDAIVKRIHSPVDPGAMPVHIEVTLYADDEPPVPFRREDPPPAKKTVIPLNVYPPVGNSVDSPKEEPGEDEGFRLWMKEMEHTTSPNAVYPRIKNLSDTSQEPVSSSHSAAFMAGLMSGDGRYKVLDKQRRKDLQLTLSITLVLVGLVLCYTPLLVSRFGGHVRVSVALPAFILHHLHAFISPVIFALCDPLIRAQAKILCRKCLLVKVRLPAFCVKR